MNLIATTINHNTAPIEIREALHLSTDEIIELLNLLKEKHLTDGFIVSTCNRTEIFGLPQNGELDLGGIKHVLMDFKGVSGIKAEHFKDYFSCGAIKHLYTVVSGLDSLVIGDSQIHGQVKESFQIALENGFAGGVFRKIFDSAIKTGKRCISETKLGEGAVSVSFAAIQVAEKIFQTFENKSALVIGAGETGELAAIHLREKNTGKIAICNRTLSKAVDLASKINGEIVPFENLASLISNFDIIVSATSSPGLILGYDEIKNAVKKRKGQPVCILDIAIPRDIDPKSSNLDSVFYHDIDSLSVIVDQNLRKRKNEIPHAEKIIVEEMINLFAWYNTLEVVPAIKKLRDFFEEIRTDEMEKIKNKINPEDVKKLDDMTKRMIGRILHNPTLKLRQVAEKGLTANEIADLTNTINTLFEPAQKEQKEYT
ncbi:MAG: glutamyl-tRNA reductase [Ignavibacteriaceae bacterium]|nr:glutamyl-tRNA reductase [Ignavibacteriaceae bacterium]